MTTLITPTKLELDQLLAANRLADKTWAYIKPSNLPMTDILKRIVTDAITCQCDVAAISTRHLLAGPCQVVQHIKSARNFFLMELESVFASFVKKLCSKVRSWCRNFDDLAPDSHLP